ncbi:MAG: ROK family transcriptional regulator [Acidimicrobiales bacterium]
MDLGAVRRHHLSLLLETLLDEGPGSRADLARRIGMTKATSSALVADLLARGLVIEELAASDGRVGRPGAEVRAASWSVGALGLQVEVDRMTALVVDLAGQVRVRHRVTADNRRSRPSAVLDRLVEVAQLALDEAEGAAIRCTGAGLAVPGLVDPATRELLLAPNLHWLDVDLTSLDRALGFEVAVDNEANLGALAELHHGATRGIGSFVHVSGGVGVGGGVVLGGQLLRGVHGFAGELGHVVVDPSGPPCACGANGCLETYVGSDAQAGAAPGDVARALAVALRSVVHLVDPEVVVLGGALADPPEVAELVAEQLAAQTLGGRWRPVEVHRSDLGPDAAAVGAATTVLEAIVADPTIVAPPDGERGTARSQTA